MRCKGTGRHHIPILLQAQAPHIPIRSYTTCFRSECPVMGHRKVCFEELNKGIDVKRLMHEPHVLDQRASQGQLASVAVLSTSMEVGSRLVLDSRHFDTPPRTHQRKSERSWRSWILWNGLVTCFPPASGLSPQVPPPSK